MGRIGCAGEKLTGFRGADDEISCDGDQWFGGPDKADSAVAADDEGSPEIIVVLNWFEELRLLVPTN